MQPLRIGVNFYPFSRFPQPDLLLDMATWCEQQGFYHLHMGEHLIAPKENDKLDNFWQDTSCMFAALSQRTKRIKFVYGIVIVPLRHPIAIARTLATVDQLSKGRVIMGCGVGWTKHEFEVLGIPFNERGARTDDGLRAIRALWSSETPSYDGRFFKFDDVIFRPGTYQKHLPMWIGGAAEATVRRAAELGNGLQPIGGPLEKLVRMANETKELMAKNGREKEIADYAFTITCDHGATVSHHSVQAGAKDYAMIVSQNSAEAIEQLGKWHEAGYNHITVRFPDKDLSALRDKIQKFRDEVVKPLGSVIEN